MRFTVGTKIWAGFGAILLLLFVLGGLSYWSVARLIAASNAVDHTLLVLTRLNDLLSSAQDAETGQRGFVITGEERYLEPYRAGSGAIDASLRDLRQLTADNPQQQHNLDALTPAVAAKLGELRDTIELRRSKGFDAAREVVITDVGKKAMDDIRKIVSDMAAVERQLLAERDRAANQSADTAVATSVAGILLACVLVGVGGFFLTRGIARPLREGTAVLVSAAGEIATITAQVASGAAETSAALTETASTVEEVKKTSQLASDKARQVADSAQRAAEVGESGRKAVVQSIETVTRMREQMEEIAETIIRLSEQSQAIGEIVATVNDLAEQSNLLAVNAAIEAAKAGEHGRGFAVVAQEVKTLADQSKQATGQVRSVLGEMQKATSAAVLAAEQGSKAVEAGVAQARAAGETIQQLAGNVADAAQAAVQIAASSQQQQVGMDQVALAMENIRTASMQNMSGTKQAEGAARNLTELGHKLKEMVGI